MNFTMTYSCSCGYQKSLNEGDKYTIKQCVTCFHIQSFKQELVYHRSCLACGHHHSLPNEYEFGMETCESCGLSGKSGMLEYDQQILFDVHASSTELEQCTVCKSVTMDERIAKCPSCHRDDSLEKHTSSVWE